MKLDRRSVVGGMLASTALLAAPTGVRGMNERRTDFSTPRFRSARDVGSPHPNAELAMNLILDAVGMARNITLYAADVIDSNIAGFATTIKGVRYIVYDRQHVPWPADETPWTSVFLIAHEIGHHASSHVFRRDGMSYRHELEADFFAAFSLNMLGASEADATKYDAGNRPATSTHPASQASREAARAGWQQAERIKRRGLGRSLPRR